MIPPRIFEGFKNVPGELVELCCAHSWSQLTRPLGEGVRSIRDILLHMVGAEAFWFGHVVDLPDHDLLR